MALLDEEEMYRVNVFDWQAAFPAVFAQGGFDGIVGNPPYVRMETFKPLKAYFKANYACHDERSDLYAYFIEKAHRLLKADGLFGMIVSNKFLRANYGAPLRQFPASECDNRTNHRPGRASRFCRGNSPHHRADLQARQRQCTQLPLCPSIADRTLQCCGSRFTSLC